jgi:hypothetical protein
LRAVAILWKDKAPIALAPNTLRLTIKDWTDWFEADIGSGLGGGTVAGSDSPAASPPAVESSATIAKPERKAATSRRFNAAGILDKDTKAAVVHAIAGDPPTVEGLDAVDAALANQDWTLLFDDQGIERPSDFPDVRDLQGAPVHDESTIL